MNFEDTLKVAQADYGRCYAIGNYMLCPEQKIVRVGRMFGTETKDCYGFFPDPTLKYGEATMVIFGGKVFFDNFNLAIDWKTAELRSYRNHYIEFADGRKLYLFIHGEVSMEDEAYDRSAHELDIEKRLEYRNDDELTEAFSVKGGTFYFKDTPILEPFDIPHLRTIVSKGGFETNYITDGKQVLFAGGKTGYSSAEENGKEYVLAKRWLVEGIDLPSLRVLGRDLLADKNALYCGETVIPFVELKGFKFIIREMD